MTSLILIAVYLLIGLLFTNLATREGIKAGSTPIEIGFVGVLVLFGWPVPVAIIGIVGLLKGFGGWLMWLQGRKDE